MFCFLCVFLFSFVFGVELYGAPHIAPKSILIENSSLNQMEKSKLIESIVKKLPGNIKLKENTEIKISFKNLSQQEIQKNYCQQEKGVKLARLALYDDSHIVVDEQFIQVIQDKVRGNNLERKGECFYKTKYELLVGTLLHEIGHVFDYNSELPYYYGREREDIYREDIYGDDDTGVDDMEERGFKRHSEIDEFKTWAIYGPRSLFFGTQNLTFMNSPNRHEFSNSKERFAIQFEFFSIDKSYACRRPNMYRYFTEVLKLSPRYQVKCQINTKIKSTSFRKKINLSNVFDVQLFVSVPHEESTPWGHSSIKILRCKRIIEEDEACPEKFVEELFLDYSMDGVQDIGEGNVINALLGRFNLSSKIREKNEYMQQFLSQEGREFFLLPLKLNKDQRDVLVDQILENHWGLWSAYVLHGNNCTHVIANMIKMAKRDYNWEVEKVLTPIKLVTEIIARGYVNREIKEFDLQRIKDLGLYLKSDDGYVAKGWRVLKNFLKLHSEITLEEFKAENSSAERMEAYSEVALLNENKRKLIYASAMVLEKYFLTSAKKNFTGVVDLKIEGWQELLAEYQKAHINLLPWNIVRRKSYGIPLIEDVYPEEILLKRVERLLESSQSLWGAVDEKNKRPEFDEIRENIENLSMKLLYQRKLIN